MNLLDARRAALTLHALPEADREWVLHRLDVGQQQLVNEQLLELKSLGVVADESLVRQALAQGAEREATLGWRKTLGLCDADRVFTLLQGEPATLIARVLAQGPWAWEAALLEQLGPSRRALVLAQRDRVRPSAALDQCLLDELARRCGDVTVASHDMPLRPPVARGWLQRLQGV